MFGGRIKTHEIVKQWDDLLRLASSMRLGTVTASLITRKLASYARENRLGVAMRELGRIERTLFLLDWMTDPVQRARVQAGLNKGETRNAPAQAVFFNRLGEVRDRTFEHQCYQASGLNLVVAVVLWNTFYLEQAVAQVRQRRNIPDDYLKFLSPLGWEHISLTEDYIWNLAASLSVQFSPFHGVTPKWSFLRQRQYLSISLPRSYRLQPGDFRSTFTLLSGYD